MTGAVLRRLVRARPVLAGDAHDPARHGGEHYEPRPPQSMSPGRRSQRAPAAAVNEPRPPQSLAPRAM